MLVISPSLAELSGTRAGRAARPPPHRGAAGRGRRGRGGLPARRRGQPRAAAAARARRRGRPRARLADPRLPARARGPRADRRDRARRHGEPPRPRAPASAPASAWTPPSGWRASARWSWDVTGDRWQWSEELYRIAGLSPTGPPPDFAALLRAIPQRAPRGDPRGDDARAARRPPVRDPLPGADARRPPADPARARRARARGLGQRSSASTASPRT